MALIKDIYSRSFYERIASSFKESIPGFDQAKFVKAIFTPAFTQMEWKQRMKHTTQALHSFMPKGYKSAASLLEHIIEQLRKDGMGNGMLEFMFLPDYVATYGIQDLKPSIRALEFVTQYISCEFAVRPFLVKYPDEMMAQMLKWSHHKSAAVRRLSSEGSRPRLPWGMAIQSLKKDPRLIVPILENLKNDPSESVRRSVANNLNDIAKDNPDVVLKIAAKWAGHNKETDAIIKHGCRTLLKQGHPDVLAHFGLTDEQVQVNEFKVATPKVSMGDYLQFSFTIANSGNASKAIRLEYGMYYKRSNGILNKKVFKISERLYAPGEICNITRRQSFKPITTRKYYPGMHKVAIVVNGVEKAAGNFELVDK
ncbi:MAG: DNA alkylation repair protein [Sphingobacteriales bacterium]|nr:MAG: DNA alkylation repair protein [Sphingobacteriales bacterium]